MWWCTPVTHLFGKLRQMNNELEARPGRVCDVLYKNQNKNKSVWRLNSSGKSMTLGTENIYIKIYIIYNISKYMKVYVCIYIFVCVCRYMYIHITWSYQIP